MISTNNLQPDTSELLDYVKWQEKGTISLTDYTRFNLTPDLAIGITKLFWPEFVVHEDKVFLSLGFNLDSFTRWQAALHGDLESVQKVMNHVLLAAVFLSKPFENMSYHNILYFGTILASVWKCALECNFPERKFEISIQKDGELDDVAITFWESQPS